MNKIYITKLEDFLVNKNESTIGVYSVDEFNGCKSIKAKYDRDGKVYYHEIWIDGHEAIKKELKWSTELKVPYHTETYEHDGKSFENQRFSNRLEKRSFSKRKRFNRYSSLDSNHGIDFDNLLSGAYSNIPGEIKKEFEKSCEPLQDIIQFLESKEKELSEIEKALINGFYHDDVFTKKIDKWHKEALFKKYIGYNLDSKKYNAKREKEDARFDQFLDSVYQAQFENYTSLLKEKGFVEGYIEGGKDE